MSDSTISVDAYPDNDSFLSRPRTKEMIMILANTKPESTTQVGNNENSVFVQSVKSSAKFNPLTFSIFWREHVGQNFEQFYNLINSPDGYNRTALNLAISSEDFVLAKKLLDNDAMIYLEDKLMLEITLTSLLQRDIVLFDKILANTPEDKKTWVKKYLDYIKQHITNPEAMLYSKIRDLLNPPLRYFGQILDTLAMFNGVPSHYGYISPSLEVLARHLRWYVEQGGISNEYKPLFKNIAEAFMQCQTSCEYIGNIATKVGAAKILADKVIAGVKAREHKCVVSCGGFAGNAISLNFIDDLLIYTNYGVGSDPKQGIAIYRINKLDAVNEQNFNLLINGLGNASDPNQILAVLGSMIDPKPIYSLSHNFTPLDNCILVNPRAGIKGLLLVLCAIMKHLKADEKSLGEVVLLVEDLYKHYNNSLAQFATDDLSKFMRNHEMLRNRRLECCMLAMQYINQHSAEADALQRCIELKNALEYVGLSDYYAAHVTQEAHEAILAYTIRQQEITALKVIEREKQLMAGNKS